MDNKERGLYAKYNVERADGQELGTCFVLELKDELARPALLVWAHTLEREGYHELAKDLFAALESFEPTEQLVKDVIVTDKQESKELAQLFDDPKWKDKFKQAMLTARDEHFDEIERIHEAHRRFQNEAQNELPFDEPTL